MMEQSVNIVQAWRHKFIALKLLYFFCFLLPCSLLLWSVIYFYEISYLYFLLVEVFLVLVLLAVFKPWSIDKQKTIRYLEDSYPWLEHSLHLIWVEPSNTLESLQQKKVNEQLSRNKLLVPVNWQYLLGGSFITLVLLFFILGFKIPKYTKQQGLKLFNQQVIANDSTTNRIKDLKLTDYSIKVFPPAYTGIRKYQQEDFSLKIPENSRISWEMSFSEEPEVVKFIFDQTNVRSFEKEKDHWLFSLIARNSGFYQIEFKDDGSYSLSSFYSIEVIEDEDPEVVLEDKPIYLSVDHPDTVLSFNVGITDDYGLTEADIILTVSSGQGESVKFREKRNNLFTDIQSEKWTKKIDIDLSSLNMTYGDELYFFIEATDNKFSQPQKGRSGTYIVSIPDTAEYETISGGGMAADIMPDYFRSQRQIIIDTEKLIKEKSFIEKAEFNSRSNSLAHDQKALRLRYGQFIGLEDDSGIATGTPDEVLEEGIEAYQHKHDHEEEHIAESEGKTDKEDPLEEYMHKHDEEEEATFLYKSVKAKLKAALEIMWDAELHLRLYEPHKSLPYQYQALKLIKEVQNHAKIYVQRIGFEPPPVKESSRLSGDLKDIENMALNQSLQETNPLSITLLHLDTLILNGKTDGLELYVNESIKFLASEENAMEYIDALESLRQIKLNPTNENAETARQRIIGIVSKSLHRPVIAPSINKPWNDKLIQALQ